MAPSFIVPRSLRRAALLVVTVGCGGPVEVGDSGNSGRPPGDATVRSDEGGPSSDATPGSDGGVASRDGSGASCPSIGDASTVATGRVPVKHRSSDTACTTQRAAVTPAACGCPDGGLNSIVRPDGSVCLCGSCAQDSDCDAGANGRCGQLGPIAYLGCSYDECSTDSDCEGGAPCECRASNLSATANVCLTKSSCRVDSDCGPNGYCSPSVVNNFCTCSSTALCGDAGGGCYVASGPIVGLPPGPGWTPIPCVCGDGCGHGYFCHTRCDTCVDDSDCGNQGTCNFDTVDHRWECEDCSPVP